MRCGLARLTPATLASCDDLGGLPAATLCGLWSRLSIPSRRPLGCDCCLGGNDVVASHGPGLLPSLLLCLMASDEGQIIYITPRPSSSHFSLSSPHHTHTHNSSPQQASKQSINHSINQHHLHQPPQSIKMDTIKNTANYVSDKVQGASPSSFSPLYHHYF